MIEYHATRGTFADQAARYAEMLDARAVYSVSVRRYYGARTTGPRSQNHHINGHCQQIAVDTGASFEAVKERMKELAVSRGYPFTTLPDGSIAPKSEANIDTIAAAALIDTIHQFCDEYQIRLVESEEEK